MKIHALIATVPERKRSCERLLFELQQFQTLAVDGVILVLDGYGDAPAPAWSLPVVRELRTKELSGAGQRWRAASLSSPEDILVNIDDDCMTIQAPTLIESLVQTVKERGGAAAAMGMTVEGRKAPPGPVSFGRLIHGSGCGFAAKARDLAGVISFGQRIFMNGGPDCLGRKGDDDALVSAHLWKTSIPIWHAPTGNIFSAPNMKPVNLQPLDAQKIALRRITGWPWPREQGKW